MPVSILLIFAVIAGMLVSSQGAVNAQLATFLKHPIQAAFVSFAVGTLSLGCVALIMGAGLPQVGSMRLAPWHLFLGGVFGAVFVTVAVLLVPKVGVANYIIAMVLGQVIASILIDHFGILGLPKITVSWNRALGASLVLVGLYVVNMKAAAT